VIVRRVDADRIVRPCDPPVQGGNMSNAANREEVVRKFLGSKVFDFAAFGKFVTENGASIASSSDSEFGFVIGNRFIRYCIPPQALVVQEIDPAAVRGEVTGR
jgi:hypothetical protein